MGKSQLNEVTALAANIIMSARVIEHKQEGDDIMILRRTQSYLHFVKSTLENIQHQTGIGSSSLYLAHLENCHNTMMAVKSILDDEPKPVSDKVPDYFKLSPMQWQDTLKEALVDLRNSANSLSVAIELSLHSGSEVGIERTEIIRRSFDELSEQVRATASRTFQPAEPRTAESPFFTVNELTITSDNNSANMAGFTIICPMAYYHGNPDAIVSTVKFRCCCNGALHESLLRYRRWPGKSLLREEICLDGSRRWNMMLFKSHRPVVVRLTDISPLSFPLMGSLAASLHWQLLKDDIKSSNNLGGVGLVAAELARGVDSECTPLEWIVNDSGFPGTQIRSVSTKSSGIERTLCNPSRATLKHYRMFPKFLAKQDTDRNIFHRALPDPYVRLVLEDSATVKRRNEVLVTRDTRLSHGANALGRLVVSLLDARVCCGGPNDETREISRVNFAFDLRKDAETFARYVATAQERLRECFVGGAMHGEKTIYFRESPATSMAEQCQFVIVAPRVGDLSRRKYRVIVSEHESNRRICFEVDTNVPDITRKGLQRSLEEVKVWVVNYDEAGRPFALQAGWESLTKRQILPPAEGTTFVKSGHERTADDWLEEIDKLIRVMKRDRNDRYERVKIAIIDSGVNDIVKNRYMAQNKTVYKDFTKEPRNDSWHGTCCAKIICDIYEEAELFVARIFEKDHANERDGPIRMAQAIDWAISPPNCVDIISISAGFRHYSKELDEAVTRAKAAGILVVAAAANWQNTGTVAFPARHNLTTMCIYSTNIGNQSSSFNPEPRSDTCNFAILGEGFQHPDQGRNEEMNGTSMATAAAVGLAANIIDFSRQQDNKSYISRAQDVGKLPGMLSIFSAISKPAGPLRYVAPLELLPLQHGSNRERDRQRVREILSQAMERAN